MMGPDDTRPAALRTHRRPRRGPGVRDGKPQRRQGAVVAELRALVVPHDPGAAAVAARGPCGHSGRVSGLAPGSPWMTTVTDAAGPAVTSTRGDTSTSESR